MKLQVYFLTVLITTFLSCSSEPINSEEQEIPEVFTPIETIDDDDDDDDNTTEPQTIK